MRVLRWPVLQVSVLLTYSGSDCSCGSGKGTQITSAARCPTSAWCFHRCPTSAWCFHRCPTSAWCFHRCPTSAWCFHRCPTSAWCCAECCVCLVRMGNCRESLLIELKSIRIKCVPSQLLHKCMLRLSLIQRTPVFDSTSADTHSIRISLQQADWWHDCLMGTFVVLPIKCKIYVTRFPCEQASLPQLLPGKS
jgi:hypothetical protein